MKTKEPERKSRGRPATGHTPQHQFRCPDDEWELFLKAAEAEDVTVATWLRQVAVKAAKRVLSPSRSS